jgi:hypothetical protein
MVIEVDECKCTAALLPPRPSSDCLLTRTHVVYPAVWLKRAVATTDDALGGELRGQLKLPGSTGTRCFSSTLEGDVMYVPGKAVDHSFEGCPEPPVAADFQKSDDGAVGLYTLTHSLEVTGFNP